MFISKTPPSWEGAINRKTLLYYKNVEISFVGLVIIITIITQLMLYSYVFYFLVDLSLHSTGAVHSGHNCREITQIIVR